MLFTISFIVKTDAEIAHTEKTLRHIRLFRVLRQTGSFETLKNTVACHFSSMKMTTRISVTVCWHRWLVFGLFLFRVIHGILVLYWAFRFSSTSGGAIKGLKSFSPCLCNAARYCKEFVSFTLFFIIFFVFFNFAFYVSHIITLHPQSMYDKGSLINCWNGLLTCTSWICMAHCCGPCYYFECHENIKIERKRADWLAPTLRLFFFFHNDSLISFRGHG